MISFRQIKSFATVDNVVDLTILDHIIISRWSIINLDI